MTRSTSVWCLAGSGSFINIADRDAHVPNAKIRKSAMHPRGVKCTGTNGSEISMDGGMAIQAYTDKGENAKLAFQHGNVSLPMLNFATLNETTTPMSTTLATS